MPIYSQEKADAIKGFLSPSFNFLREGEIQFIISWAQKTGGPVLELACGAGRVMMKLAESGFNVFGIDASQPMVEMGGKAILRLSSDIQKRIKFILGDMCNFAFSRKFPLIIIPHNSFWYNLDHDGAEQSIRCIISSLDESGVFLIDNPHVFADGYTGPYNKLWWWNNIALKYSFSFSVESYSPGPLRFHHPQAGNMLVGRKK